MSEAIFTIWTSISSWFTPTVFFCLLNLTIGTIYISSNFISTHNNPPNQNQNQNQNEDYSDYNPQNSAQLARAPSLVNRVFSLYRSDSLDPPPQPETHHPDPSQTRPSILDRVKSIKYFSPSRSDSPDDASYTERPETHQPEPAKPRPDPVQTRFVRAPSFLERVKSFNFSQYGYDHPDPNHHSKKEPKPNPDPGYDHLVVRSRSDTTGAGEGQGHVKLRKSASERWEEEEEEPETVEEEERRRPATVKEGKGTTAAGFFGEQEEEEGGVDAKADDFIDRFKQQLKLQRLDSLLRYREMLTRGSSR